MSASGLMGGDREPALAIPLGSLSLLDITLAGTVARQRKDQHLRARARRFSERSNWDSWSIARPLRECVHHPTSADERHLSLQPVDRTGTQAYKPGRLAYSSAPRELLAGSLHLVGFSTRATEIAADDPRLAGELLPTHNLRLDGRQPCFDAL